MGGWDKAQQSTTKGSRKGVRGASSFQQPARHGRVGYTPHRLHPERGAPSIPGRWFDARPISFVEFILPNKGHRLPLLKQKGRQEGLIHN